MTRVFPTIDDHIIDIIWTSPVDHSRRSETIGWLVMVALAFLVFELTADSWLAVVVGCLKFGTPDLKVARWLRRADPDRVRGCACSWFYVVLAIMRIGYMAFVIMIVGFAAAGMGVLQAKLERQLLGAALVIFACFLGAAMASWVAVASALRSGFRVWIDASARSAARAGLWPPLLPERCRRADFGPGLVVIYAVFTGWFAMLTILMITGGLIVGLGFPEIMLGIVLMVLCAIVGLFLTPRALWQIPAPTPWDCYGYESHRPDIES